jgi:ribosomal subunit interface protein
MELVVRTQHGHLSPETRARIEEKIAHLSRYMNPIRSVIVDVSVKDKHHRVQLTVTGEHGVLLRAEEKGSELMHALDDAMNAVRKQIEHYKGRHWRNAKRHDATPSAAEVADPRPDMAPAIVRTKSFTIKPMDDEEALEQMELLGHTFYVYRDHDATVRVIYRRSDGRHAVIITA